MKKKLSIVLLFVSILTLNAQKNYLGVGTGLSNISGMAGFQFEAPINANFSGKVGAGLGAWGTKMGISAKYYREFPSSMSFGIGYSTASGLKGVELEVELASGTKQKEKVDLSRSHNLDFTIGKSWGETLRFNLEFGYSIKLSGGKSKVENSSITISDTFQEAMDLLSPGGLIIGIGLAYGF